MQKKSVAIFEVFIIIFSIFIVVDFSYAIDVCCEKTIDGSSCIFTDESNCNNNYNMAAANCNELDYCRIGCCINDEGCFKSVLRSSCDGEFRSDKECGYGECSLGCCVLGNECSYVTENRCRNLVNTFSDEEMDYRDVNSEEECVNICRSDVEGCCVDNGVYIYSKAEDCDGEFYYNEYCSNIGGECESRNYKDCYDDDVYWFDSCGNREDKEEECDYISGTRCNRETLTCENLNCESTYSDERNVHDSRIGGSRENGESWCLYESPTGNYLDRPGSRHYRAMCVDGEEIIEECRDYREEICFSDYKNGFSEANCVPHEEDDGVPSLISTVPIGFEFWEDDGECNEASQTCVVVFVKKNRISDFECKQNCFCLEQSYTDQMAEYCKSLGDCGDDYNIVEVMGEGFNIDNNNPNPNVANWLKYGVFGGMEDNAGDILDKIGNKQFSTPGIMDQPFSAGYMGANILLGAIKFLPTLASKGWLGTSLVNGLTKIGILEKGAETAAGSVFSLGGAGMILSFAGIALTIISFIIFSGGKVKYVNVNTNCNPWQAPDGGDDCSKCDDFLSCSEYKCRSLGQNCRYILDNVGTDRSSCYNSNPNDANSPIINPWQENITQSYTARIEGNGFSIIPGVEPYRQLSVGIKTDELSQCKISREHSLSYDNMEEYFGDNYFDKQHSIMLNLEPGTENNFYVKCKDPSGNKNNKDYYIKIITRQGPDLTAPIIYGFNFENNIEIPNYVNNTGIVVYVNEPSECRFSYDDRDYNAMNSSSLFCGEESVSNFTSSYVCMGNVDLDLGENNYYFRCKDISNNINRESKILKLIKTDLLEILEKEPSGELYYNDITLGLRTNRESICSFDIGYGLTEFYNTNDIEHSQHLQLDLGNYNANILCIDDVGNVIEDTIEFSVNRDLEASRLIHVYKSGNDLKIVLNEASYCEYNGENFNLGEGIETEGNMVHSLTMTNITRYFIICKDQFDNIMDEIIVYP